jgi:hypothetical protein
MYVTLPEELSHAQRSLVTLIEKRVFSPTLIQEWGVPKSYIIALYRTAIGRIRPSYMAIYTLRSRIAPVNWYYTEQEAVPGAVPFTALYAAGGDMFREKVMRDETAALRELAGIREARNLSLLCRNYNIEYKRLSQCVLKRVKEDGSRGYHQRPAYDIVKALRERIHPDLWYIFPEELITD